MRSLGKPIARGGTAEIYAWQEKQTHCVKLFQAWFPSEEIEQEAKITHLIYEAGLPVPEVGEVIEINKRIGIIYERVEGQRLLGEWNTTPSQLWKAARFLAELQADIHSHQLAGLPLQRKQLVQKINALLPPASQESALNILTTLPDGDQLCHGDFHPYNVLITERGPIIVDWGNATSGNPLADVARTSLLLTSGILPPGILNQILLRLVRGWFSKCYIERYRKVGSCDHQQLKAWQPVIAAAFLNSNNKNRRKKSAANHD